jgi:alkylhydroperoxidase family enzyme
VPRYRQSDLLTEREKLAMGYAAAVTRTPVEVADEFFAHVNEHFADEQLPEITALPAVVNLDRVNAAFGVGARPTPARCRRRAGSCRGRCPG